MPAPPLITTVPTADIPIDSATKPAAEPLDEAVAQSPLARMALARARMRAVIPLDVVSFVAACPACGDDCEWTQERHETRVRSTTNCPCGPTP